MIKQTGSADLLTLTAEIVSAHLSNNPVSADDIPSIIQKVYKTLANVDDEKPVAPGRPQPAVPVKRSVTPDYIICLEDGKKLKTLKRHLRTAYGMTLEEYKERWGLPPEYPMVAPNYAARRSALAKESGLGTLRGKAPKARKAQKKRV